MPPPLSQVNDMNNKNANVEIGRRLSAARGTRKRDEFAEVIGVHVATLGRYERGETPLPADLMLRICDITGCSADWLLLGREESRAVHEDAEPYHVDGESLVRVPVLAKIPAGIFAANSDGDYPAGAAEKYIRVADPKDENAYALVVDGDSMEPYLSIGDIVLISPRQRDNASYPICVIRMRGEDVALKTVRVVGETVYLKSTNEAYPPIELPAMDVEVIGRAITRFPRTKPLGG